MPFMGRGNEDGIFGWIPDENKDDDFDQARRLLIQNNFVINTLLKQIRKKFRIPPVGFRSNTQYNQWCTKILKSKGIEGFKEIFPILNKISDELFLERSYFQSLVYYGNSRVFLGRNYVRTVGWVMPGGHSLADSITERGVYIKVNHSMSKSDWIKAQKQAKKVFNSFYQIEKRLPNPKHKNVGYNLKEDVKIYLEVENAILASYKVAGRGYDFAMLERDENNAVVDRALEEIVNRVDYQDDKILDKERNKLKARYYEISRRFNLPTLRKLSKLTLLV